MMRDKAHQNPYAPLGPERQHYWMALRMAKATPQKQKMESALLMDQEKLEPKS